MDLQKQNTILVTCGPGLAEYLEAELVDLGFNIESSHAGGVTIKGTGADVMMLNLRLRTAYNVLYLLNEFRCSDAKQLYKIVNTMPWEGMISPDEYLSVVSRVKTPAIDNSMFASMKVKDAIVDRISAKLGERPDSGSERDCLVYNLYWRGDRCWLYLNTSGLKLSDRSYRKMPYKAPLRESLAAGIVMATGYDGSVPFVNPMCGSGTLAIEAALIGAGRACGLLRSNFGFMHELGFDKEKWVEIRREASKLGGKDIKRIVATDISVDAIRCAQKNAMTAGVQHLIDFKVCDYSETPVPEEGGIVVFNPEYGMRLGDADKLEPLYEGMGDFMKQCCAGYMGYIFTGNMQLGKKVGLRAKRRLVFFNGDIECRLLTYELYSGSRE
ncbi:MAG: class I SAM-dependent RNA methyltransferase [Planctomycetes bacterium]|nr:class I SAM-dependent RNA methyltransferase [Planctomycetota bacterium]